ncbi:MAG TPA: hypothetical protein VK774_10585, partial [Solirubrobacteraceae bacterium]|nr:hypothetical protein [Solirubrobacteraceae bacterium]
MSTARELPPPHPTTRPGVSSTDSSIVVAGLVAFALVSLLLAAMLAFAPHAFFEDIGPYGTRNDHYMR